MNNRRFFMAILLAAILGGVVAAISINTFQQERAAEEYSSIAQRQDVQFTNFVDPATVSVPDGLNFITSAKVATPGVVHIRSTISESGAASQVSPFDFFRDFFDDPRGGRRGGPQRQAVAFGSGVIISDDGYIATNNHVIESASKLEVTLNDNRRYEAELIGTDPTTDLALLKIEESGLPYIKYGNSDDVLIGEWVLAVGNPFDLTSTVTAGIVSAKARNIDILRDDNGQRQTYGVESFIQTDAAVNPGNSGGALVNLKGELIGINTAIASRTGSYAGYSFAVPVSLVEKVMDDLLEFGEVQRALLGISIVSVNAETADQFDIKGTVQGVYVQQVVEDGAAENAGLKEGDVIIAIDNNQVNSTPELQELVARNRPGDKIKVEFLRDGRKKEVYATLKARSAETIERIASASRILGADLSELTDREKDALDLDHGVKLMGISSGKWREIGIKDGFVITEIDNERIDDVDDLMSTLSRKEGDGILIEGVYPNGEKAYYGTEW